MEQMHLLLLLFLCSHLEPTSQQQDVQAALQDLTTKLKELQTKIAELQLENHVQATELRNLHTWGVEAANHVDNLRANRKDQATELTTLKSWKLQAEKQQTDQASELTTLKRWKLQAEKKQTEQATELQSLKSHLDSLLADRTGARVAFSASLLASGKGYTGPFTETKTLEFKHVRLNIGSAYSPDTGKFTAPLRGVYHFNFHVGTGRGPPGATLVLVKNGEYLCTASELPSDDKFGNIGNEATVLLEVGNTVYVRLWESYRVFDNSYHHCTFSGRLLFPI